MIRENSHAFELSFFHELLQLFELSVCFTRETDNERRSHDEAINAISQLANEFFGLIPVDASLHPFQDLIVNVLQRHIEIRNHFGRIIDRINQFIGKWTGYRYINRIQSIPSTYQVP